MHYYFYNALYRKALSKVLPKLLYNIPLRHKCTDTADGSTNEICRDTEVPVKLELRVQADWFAQHAFSRILSCVMFFYKIASCLTTVYKDVQTSNHKQHFSSTLPFC